MAGLGFGRRATPAQKTQAIQELRQTFPLNVLLSVAQLPRATFYYQLKRQERPDKYAEVKEEIQRIHAEHTSRWAGVIIWRTADIMTRR